MACNLVIIILVIIVALFFLLQMDNTYVAIEGYNDQTGQFCTTCKGKTMNQCFQCFNCGWAIDEWGNSGCIGGDHKGPYNFERVAKWYHTDPWTTMQQRNNNYRCSYGPRSSNRLIGI